MLTNFELAALETEIEARMSAPQYTRHPEQPISTDIRMADGVFMKTMVLPKAGMIVPQHAHEFAHVSVLVRGSVRVTATPPLMGKNVFRAPGAILILANVKHLFESLEDDTIVLCVHDIGTAEGVSVLDEHHIV